MQAKLHGRRTPCGFLGLLQGQANPYGYSHVSVPEGLLFDGVMCKEFLRDLHDYSMQLIIGVQDVRNSELT